MAETVEQLTASAVRAAREVRVGMSRLRRRLRETTDRRELTPSQTSVLSRLDRDGPATASALAAAERVRPQSIAATIAVLEQRALVERRPDPSDGRRQVVSLTAGGRAVISSTRAESEEWLTRALQDHLSEAERRTVIEAMALLDRVSGA
jgi:DNA-binding MarR family transcriptional regulator